LNDFGPATITSRIMPQFPPAASPTENHLLGALCGDERSRFLLKLQSATLSLGQVLHQPGGPVECVYFPTNSVVSLVYTMQNGSTAEIGLVGNDGVVGIELFLGGERTTNRAMVQIAGEALRIPARLFQEEVAHDAAVERILLRYTQSLFIQTSQIAVCNRLHSVEQRLCRWLLMCHDRVDRSELLMTQELLANVLGGRRESVTVAAGHLQDAGLIHYKRGHITILNRPGLESSTCECYRVVAEETGRLFSRKPGSQLSGEKAFEAAG
jgi:CRP-like cAMP-binding protein